MRLLVAGGRNKYLDSDGYDYLDELWYKHSFVELFNGMATGIDECAREWAKHRNIPIRPFYANWTDIKAPGAIIKKSKSGRQYNAKAGPDRNLKMIVELSLDAKQSIVVVFPGGDGTDDLHDRAVEYCLNIYDLRNERRYIK